MPVSDEHILFHSGSPIVPPAEKYQSNRSDPAYWESGQKVKQEPKLISSKQDKRQGVSSDVLSPAQKWIKQRPYFCHHDGKLSNIFHLNRFIPFSVIGGVERVLSSRPNVNKTGQNILRALQRLPWARYCIHKHSHPRAFMAMWTMPMQYFKLW